MVYKPDARAIREQLLLEEEVGYSNGLYRYTQIELAYNSNRIEGSTLTRDHTRSLYETNTILADKDVVIRANDVVEMNNHFQAFRYILHNAEKPLDEALIKNIHKILLTGTKQAEQDWFNVGEYKKLDNCIGSGVETCSAKKVSAAMKKLIMEYSKTEKTVENIIDFHASFEKIHPFQDGNGRTGRLVMFKECLGNDIVPFIIDEQHKAFYIRGLQNYPDIKGYLVDTCLSAQDKYEMAYNKFKFPEKKSCSEQHSNKHRIPKAGESISDCDIKVCQDSKGLYAILTNEENPDGLLIQNKYFDSMFSGKQPHSGQEYHANLIEFKENSVVTLGLYESEKENTR